MAKAWFAYIGTGSPVLPENFLRMTDKPACTIGFHLCAIYAENGSTSGPPSNISQNLKSYIANGFSNGVPEPRLPDGAKKYVYMRLG